jgi:hypothetical protein
MRRLAVTPCIRNSLNGSARTLASKLLSSCSGDESGFENQSAESFLKVEKLLLTHSQDWR